MVYGKDNAFTNNTEAAGKPPAAFCLTQKA